MHYRSLVQGVCFQGALHPWRRESASSGVCIRGQGVCLQGGGDVCLQEGSLDPTPGQTRKAGATHPTGMFPCFVM